MAGTSPLLRSSSRSTRRPWAPLLCRRQQLPMPAAAHRHRILRCMLLQRWRILRGWRGGPTSAGRRSGRQARGCGPRRCRRLLHHCHTQVAAAPQVTHAASALVQMLLCSVSSAWCWSTPGADPGGLAAVECCRPPPPKPPLPRPPLPRPPPSPAPPPSPRPPSPPSPRPPPSPAPNPKPRPSPPSPAPPVPPPAPSPAPFWSNAGAQPCLPRHTPGLPRQQQSSSR